MSMFLIQKGKKARAYCRECSAFHSVKECPITRPADYPTEAEWRSIRRAADEFAARAAAYCARVERVG